MKNKKRIVTYSGLACLVFLASVFFYSKFYSDKSFALSGSGLNQSQTEPTPATLANPIPGFWEKLVSDVSLSVVGIQVFQDNKLVRQGSGLIASSDGLVVTTADLGIKNAIYQIYYEDKILRADIVTADYKSNLMLLRSTASFASVARFDSLKVYQSGIETMIVGKLIDNSKPTLFSQKGLISYVTDRSVVLDSSANSYDAGSGIIDSSGSFIGLGYVRNGKILLIKTPVIDLFVKNFLADSIK